MGTIQSPLPPYRTRYSRGLRSLQAAHAIAQEQAQHALDSEPELAAMQALVAVLYARAEAGDSPQWRAQLLDRCDDETAPALRALIQAGVVEDELYDSVFEKLTVLAKTRHEAQEVLTRKQYTITQAQVLELLAAWLAGIRSEVDQQVYGRLVPRLLRLTPDIGLDQRVAADE